MIKENDILELKAEKNIFEGNALCHIEDKAVFVKGIIEGELAKVKIEKVFKNYAKANLVEIIKASNKRIKPACPLSKPCGGCDYSHIEYNHQLKIKEDIIKEIFSNFEKPDIKPILKSPETKQYRTKAQFQASETKNSKRVILGYYKENTHEIVNIKYCPIQGNEFDEIIDFIRNNWTLGCYIEKKGVGLLRNVILRKSTEPKGILITFVLNTDDNNLPDIKDFTERLIKEFPIIKGVLLNLNNKKTNKITGEKTILISGENFLIQKLKSKTQNELTYKIGALSFFQVNPACASVLFDCAKDLIEKKGTLLDLYGGAGTIGIFMKDKVTKITLVEENNESITLAKENYKLNEILKYEVFESSAKEQMKKFIREKRTFENIVIDPPRKGADIETIDSISKMTNNLIYISCNPMTLKRDSEILIQKGFEFVSIQPVDMFPNTHHIECVALFKKTTAEKDSK